MKTAEIIIISVFILGIGWIVYLVFRDPIYMFKTFLRGLKSFRAGRLAIVFIPIWGPFWLIDKLFGFKIFIDKIEDASKPKSIDFKDYDLYVLIDTYDTKLIELILWSFEQEEDFTDCQIGLNGAEVSLAKLGDNSVLKLDAGIGFNSFNALVQYIDNSAPSGSLFHTKAILLDRRIRDNSYFCFVDTAYLGKLIGKTINNRKMYVNIDHENQDKGTIYFNSNMVYFKNFNFDRFRTNLFQLRFKNVIIKYPEKQ